MKKLLGISLVAALAVAPSLARAEAGDRTVSALNAQAATASANIATTSYVQGAYKATADKIDALIEDTAVAENGNYIDAGKTVSHNLSELDTAIKTVADQRGDYVTHTEGAVTVGENQSLTYLTGSTAGTNVGSNLGKLDIAIKANADNIATNASDINTLEGRMDTAEANINELQTNMNTAQNDIDALEGRMDTAEDDIDALEGKVGNLIDGTYTDGQTVSADINALDTGLSGLASTVSGLSSTMNSDFATKEGVVATINHSTASGTVTVYDTWDSSHNQPVTVSSTVTSPATNAYYATIGAAAGTTQTDTTPAPAQGE